MISDVIGRWLMNAGFSHGANEVWYKNWFNIWIEDILSGCCRGWASLS